MEYVFNLFNNDENKNNSIPLINLILPEREDNYEDFLFNL